MGASTFWITAEASTAFNAFQRAQALSRAQLVADEEKRRGRKLGRAAARDYVCDLRPYTGTILEKSGFYLVEVPAGVDPLHHAEAMLKNDESLVADKWGPAACVQLGPNRWHFFGWASS